MGIADRLRYLMITGLGTGLAPVAPGTFGTLPGVAIAWGLDHAYGERSHVFLAILTVVLLGFGCRQTAFTLRVFQSKDPGAFVLDEVVGYLVTALIAFAWIGSFGWVGHAWAFVLFRIFDVSKAWPTNRLERIPGAIGIMLDDVMAGIWAGIVMVLGYELGLVVV